MFRRFIRRLHIYHKLCRSSRHVICRCLIEERATLPATPLLRCYSSRLLPVIGSRLAFPGAARAAHHPID
jgi:hypothetical protein